MGAVVAAAAGGLANLAGFRTLRDECTRELHGIPGFAAVQHPVLDGFKLRVACVSDTQTLRGSFSAVSKPNVASN